jgi:predicted nucleic acid-binding Zn ribbon protein
MTRRRAPRRAGEALRAALEGAAPKTTLAAVQADWEPAVGERIAAVAQPLSEQDGTVVVGCTDPVWADELDLMQDRLLGRLRERLGDQAPQRLRFRADRTGP